MPHLHYTPNLQQYDSAYQSGYAKMLHWADKGAEYQALKNHTTGEIDAWYLTLDPSNLNAPRCINAHALHEGFTEYSDALSICASRFAQAVDAPYGRCIFCLATIEEEKDAFDFIYCSEKCAIADQVSLSTPKVNGLSPPEYIQKLRTLQNPNTGTLLPTKEQQK
jgi:hypothetical protein